MDRPRRKTVVIGLLGVTLDRPRGDRWSSWRPSVGLCQQQDLVVDRFELLHQKRFGLLAEQVEADLASVSPETEVRRSFIEFRDPWDFQNVYSALHDFVRDYPFRPDEEDYLVHITTGTHVAQICLFLLTESRRIPGRLLQTSPPRRKHEPAAGTFQTIDLDLSRYDELASRFAVEHREGADLLKSGIATRNAEFNRRIDELERVAIASTAPILLMGPTGAGKSQLARRVDELKRARRQLDGPFVEVNCATLRGDGAMSALFGHEKGAFTGAVARREGVLRRAHGGLLFLDEIGELGLDEQAMLLRAVEEKRFLPLGADREVESDFQLIAGTNRDLERRVADGMFRDDLLARINLWTFRLPGLRDRIEDLEPNLDYELERFAEREGARVSFAREARRRYVAFAMSSEAAWAGNFRDLNASVTRMATLAGGGRISIELVGDEIERLRVAWRHAGEGAYGGVRSGAPGGGEPSLVVAALGEEAAEAMDRFDRVQLEDVLGVCRRERTASAAGRVLFAASLARRSSTNDADRLRKYLARHGLRFDELPR